MSHYESPQENEIAARSRQRRGVKLWLAITTYVILGLAVAAAAVVATVSYETREAARSAETRVGEEATNVSQRYAVLKSSYAEQLAVFKEDEEAALGDGFELTEVTGVYSRGGAIYAPEEETYCTQFEGCFLFVLRTNSLTECPAGVTVELLTSTGETLHSTNAAPLPRNGTLQMEVDWPPVDGTAVLNSATCD